MALLVISKAISDGVKRNVAASELKHTSRIDDLKHELATKALLRLKHHSRKYAEALNSHQEWLGNLTDAQRDLYTQCEAQLTEAVASI